MEWGDGLPLVLACTRTCTIKAATSDRYDDN